MKFSKSTLIIGGIVIIGILGLLGYVAFNGAPGALIGGLAGIWASFKSKLFGKSATEITAEHVEKREEWARIKEEYDSNFRALKARMDYLDYRSAEISLQLKELDEEEQTRINKIRNLSREERVELANYLLSQL
ncbi:MAG: hypothetical protein JSW54_11170 [Fidelibacterota bacterium]|nr:MAG: hypothetical protein JSW54_11170 [Candidatus Neomarinimicrobiota bacterium]